MIHMKIIDEVKWKEITMWGSNNLKEVWSTKFTTFHCIYRELTTKSSTVTRLTDW